MNNNLIKGDLIIYEDANDKIEIEAFLYDETIWLPLNKIAELFEKDKSTISEHIKNIFEEGELESSRRNFAFYSQSSDLSHHNSGVPFGTGRLANALVIYFTSVFFCCLINFINHYASFVTIEFRSTLQNFLFSSDYLHSIIIYEIYSVANSH